MRHLFTPPGLEALEGAIAEGCLVAFDYDGTLAPIVSDRRLAVLEPRTRALLREVCVGHASAVISGRGRDDVLAFLGDVHPDFVVGNHGMEPGEGLEEHEATMRAASEHAVRDLAGVAGVEIEDKRYSLSIHFLGAADREEARRRIFEAIEALPLPVRVVDGKNVVNVLPRAAPNKGGALRSLRARAGTPRALFVGDDVTDEDVFALAGEGGLVGVRVGASDASAAAFFVRDRAEVDELLAWLAAHPRRARS